ncbi:protein kinase NNK1 [Sugiyamaella lignohabitans]|uniref:Protein kinase NNK1 n=1 Tax=Sugiyamaella lignohabitans TaxID=796027 RepID=A0A167FXK9_9ASCO|nr:protein kinase NNK1 [Sugiyamaella lignohabitans]ANB15833.1 protein kinase NNK1 [Sugiyamaella lignohabitans]
MLIQGKTAGVGNSSSSSSASSSPPNHNVIHNIPAPRTHVTARSMSNPTMPVSIPSGSNKPTATIGSRAQLGSPPVLFTTGGTTSTSPNRSRLYQQLTPLVVPRVRGPDSSGSSASNSLEGQGTKNAQNNLGPSLGSISADSGVDGPVNATQEISRDNKHFQESHSQFALGPSSSSYVAAAAMYDPSTEGIGAEYIPGSVTSTFEPGTQTDDYMKMDVDQAVDMDRGIEGLGEGVGMGQGTVGTSGTGFHGISGPAIHASGLSRGLANERNSELTLGIVDKPRHPSQPVSNLTTTDPQSYSHNTSASTHNISIAQPPTQSSMISPEYLPGEIEFSPTIASAYMLSSPTLGLSEADWKKIPFSTRKKLKNALETSSPLTISSKDLPPQLTGALKSAPISRVGSMNNNSSFTGFGNSSVPTVASASSSPRQPFSRRMKERSATMYPALGNIEEGMKRAFASSPRNPHLSRSTSLSNNSSYSDSPAYQYLSKFGSLTSDSTTSGGAGSITSRNASFVGGASNYPLYGDPEMGEQIGSFFLGKMIGYGGFSQVREAHTIDEETGSKLVRAVKIVKKFNPSTTAEDMERVQNEFDHEVSLWKTLDHPHILKLMSVEANEKATYCFTERITGGTLFDLVKSTRGKNLDYNALASYVFQLGSALLYLHESKFIVHRDVKLENCLLEDIGNGQHKVVLCDFGLSDYYGKSNINSRTISSINIAASNSMNSQFESKNNSPDSSRSILTSTSSGSERSMNLIIGPSETSSILSHHQNPNSTISRSSLKTPSAGGNQELKRRSTSPARLFTSEKSNGPTSAMTANCGSMPYASPELLLSEVPILDPAIDIWAYGVVIHGLYMGQLPWNHSIPPILRSMILNNPWDEESMSKKVGPEITNLVTGCLNKDMNKRSTIRDIIYKPMFSKLRQEHSEVLS